MEQKTILIVDDESRFRFSLGLILKSHGFIVLEAEHGGQALEILADNTLRDNEVDLVITDIKMPGFDGLELIKNIIDRKYSTQIIVMTGYGNRQTMESLKNMGCTRVVHKPFDQSDLMNMIHAAMKSS